MRKLTLILMCLIGFVSANAQIEKSKFELAMISKLKDMQNAKTIEDWQNVANGFERIATAEKTQWLPYYYASFSNLMMNYIDKNQDKKNTETNINKAEEMSDAAMKLNVIDSSEMYCLQSMIASSKIMLNPMVNGMKYGPQAEEFLNKAMAANIKNPRPFYLQGESYYYRPAAFGGSKKKALKYFMEAQNKFETFEPESEISPNWGKERLEFYINSINNGDSKE